MLWKLLSGFQSIFVGLWELENPGSFGSIWKKGKPQKIAPWKLTYPTWGKGKSSSKWTFSGDMWSFPGGYHRGNRTKVFLVNVSGLLSFFLFWFELWESIWKSLQTSHRIQVQVKLELMCVFLAMFLSFFLKLFNWFKCHRCCSAGVWN